MTMKTLPSNFKIGLLLIFREKMYKNVLVGINGLTQKSPFLQKHLIFIYISMFKY